jgi:hypothetical protein
MTHTSCRTVYDNEEFWEDVGHDVRAKHVYKFPSQTAQVPTGVLHVIKLYVIRLPVILIG